MTTKTRWLVGIAVVAAVIVGVAGLGIAGSRGTSPVAGTMMDGTSTGAGMMDGTWGGMTQSGSMTGASMGAGMATMMSGVDMDAMHEQMMAALAGKVPAAALARCDAMHDQMQSSANETGAASSGGHAAHHQNQNAGTAG